jgi:hypothetical protein
MNELIERVVSAWRPRNTDGELRPSSAWHDLDADARIAANEATTQMRRLEAALDPEGMTTTAHAVLAAITGR